MKELMNFKTSISTLKLEGHMHSAKIISFFTINHDDIHKFRLKFATECKYACEDVFATFCGWTCVYTDRVLYSQNSNFSKSSAQCSVPNLRLTEVPNSFHDFLIGLLEGHFCNDYFLTSELLFILFLCAYVDIRIFIDSVTVDIRIWIGSATTSTYFPKTNQNDRT